MTKKQILKLKLLACSCGLALMLGAADARAQTQLPTAAEEAASGAASAGRAQQRFEEEALKPRVSPNVEVRDLVLQQPPPGAENIRFDLNSVQLEGVTAYEPGTLEGVYAGKIGTTITLSDVYGIATALTNKYRNDGYILTQVVVPPQTIDGGNVQLRVVEGFVDKVLVEGSGEESELNLIRRYAGNIRTNKAVNVKDLEKYLLLINDLPGVEARSILSPSRTQTGASDLRIIVERDPYDALLAVDNYGSRYLGPVQLSAAGSLNSPFGLNERITGQVVLAPDYDQLAELAYVSLGYEIPVGDYGTTVDALASHTATEPGYNLDQFDVKGRSQYFRIRANHPVYRTRSQNFSIYSLFDWRDIESKNNLEPTRHDRIRALRAGLNYQFLDTLLGVGINAVNLEVAKGLDIFGSSDEGDLRLTRAQGDPTFTKATAEIQRLQRVTSEVNVLVAARGQLSNDALLSSEEFGVGGINMGRGFDPSEIIGDEGIAGKFEIQWNEPHKVSFLENYQLFSFYDAGRVWNDDPTTSSQKTDTVTSAGFGARADFLNDIKAGLAVAFPLNRDVETQGDRDPKLYFNLNRSF